jgi:hypothetical protein
MIDDSGEGENGLRNGLLIDFDHAIHDTLNREDRTVRSVHDPSPDYWNCVVSDELIAGNDSMYGD